MFARSGSSIKDQALYTPVRVEHLKELSKSSLNGRCDFSSKMRVGIGKENWCQFAHKSLMKLPNYIYFVPLKVKLLELILAIFTAIKGFDIAQFST